MNVVNYDDCWMLRNVVDWGDAQRRNGVTKRRGEVTTDMVLSRLLSSTEFSMGPVKGDDALYVSCDRCD
jgi:hypothetical protein